MSSNNPPNPYFSGINFNSSFFSAISSYLTQTIADSRYLRLIGGTLSGFLGINRTARAALDINGTAIINDGNYAPPANGIYGSSGTKLILKEGTVSTTPMGFGVDTNAIYYGTTATAEHNFYNGTNKNLIINSSGNVGIGNNISSVNSSSILDVRGNTFINVSSTYSYASSAYGQSLSLSGTGTGTWGQMYIFDSANTSLQYTGLLMKADNANNLCSISSFRQGSATAIPLILNSVNGNSVGIGTTANINGLLTCYSATQSLPRITLTGTEYYQGSSSTDGVALLLGVNRSTNRQLWVADSSNLSQCIRLIVGSGSTIDANGASLSICSTAYFPATGGVGVGTTSIASGFLLDVNGSVRAGTTGQGYVGLLGSGGTTQAGLIGFYKSDGTRLGYIGNIDSTGNNLLLQNENGLSGWKIGGQLMLGGQISTTNNNFDINIWQNPANTTGGNITLAAIGNGGSINFATSSVSQIRLYINPQGYIVNNTGALSSQMAQYLPTATGTAGYWLIPIPFIMNNNFYNMAMISVYNNDNGPTWWSGHFVANNVTAAYTTIANSGFIQLNSGLVLNGGGVICLKIGFNNGFNILASHILYFKYIG